MLIVDSDRHTLFAPSERQNEFPSGPGSESVLAFTYRLADAVFRSMNVDHCPGDGLAMIVTELIAIPLSAQFELTIPPRNSSPDNAAWRVTQMPKAQI